MYVHTCTQTYIYTYTHIYTCTYTHKYLTILILVLCLLCVTPLVCSSYSSFAPSSPFFSSWWQKNCQLFTLTHVLQGSPSTSSRQPQTTHVFAGSRIVATKLICSNVLWSFTEKCKKIKGPVNDSRDAGKEVAIPIFCTTFIDSL